MTPDDPLHLPPWDAKDDALHRTMADVRARLDDPKRLNAVRSTLARPVPALVDALIRALAADLDSAFAAVTILDATHQHFLATTEGVMESCAVGSTGCQFVIGSGAMVALNNTSDDGFISRLLKAWRKPRGSVAYLGVPLKDEAGEVLGAVCVVDTKPRVWTAEEHFAVFETSQLVSRILAGQGD